MVVMFFPKRMCIRDQNMGTAFYSPSGCPTPPPPSVGWDRSSRDHCLKYYSPNQRERGPRTDRGQLDADMKH